MKRVDVVLATFNGEKYLPSFLNSLLQQSNKNWRLIYRDDCSTDNSKRIVEAWIKLNYIDALVINDGRGRLGVVENFSTCLEYADGDYIFLADQDDFWLPEKISFQLAAMMNFELENPEIPLLIYSDLSVVDASLNILHPSFSRSLNYFSSKDPDISEVLVQNIAPGCSMLINNFLLKKAIPIPSKVLMHDWWLLLIATAVGRAKYLDKSLILYRQHDTNVIGAKKRENYIEKYLKYSFFIEKTQVQAESLSLVKGIDNSKLEKIKAYSGLRYIPFLKRKIFFFKYSFFKRGFFRNLLFFLKI